MPDMNPYNFVRIHPMAKGARQKPLGHKRLVDEHEGEQAYNGRLQGTLTAFGPLMILSHDPNDIAEEPRDHKHFQRFFHYPGDERPVIPGSSFKGLVRSIAEAATNGCLSILNEVYTKRWDDFSDAYPPSLHFCGGLDTGGEFCPTCRVFGTAPEKEAGTSETGAYPQAFQGKVRFSDAVFQGSLDDIYDDPARLIILAEPKLSEQVWYHVPKRGHPRYPLAGRKFYYHHDDLAPQTDDSDDRLRLRATVSPLEPGATFDFRIDFRNLLESELRLLLYALELEPATSLVQTNGDSVTFNWQAVKDHKGIYPKLGYAKPAGLGSAGLLVTEIALLDPATRYGGGDNDWGQQLAGAAAREFVEDQKKQFRLSQTFVKDERRYWQPYFFDLRQILRFPNDIGTFRYPTLNEFRKYKARGIKLPIPGHEDEWRPR